VEGPKPAPDLEPEGEELRKRLSGGGLHGKFRKRAYLIDGRK